MKITMAHVRQAKMCAFGTRKFFKRHNLDFKKFLAEGLDEELILSTNDAMAKQVVEVARGQQ